MRWPCLLLLLVVLSPVRAEEGGEDLPPFADPAEPFLEDPPLPLPPAGPLAGRAQPAAGAPPTAYRIKWDEYVSLLVVGAAEGAAVRAPQRPAWIVTYDASGAVVVAYRATAFRDAGGTLHFDARRAIISGPKRDQWSPDSFAIGPDGSVQALDDQNRGNGGAILETVTAEAGEPYQRLLQIAMSIVREVG